MTYKDGGYREGTFVEGKLQGEGVMVFKSGRYEGGFKNGEPHGKGVFTWDKGGRYEGDMIEGKRTGKGVYKFPDGGRYEGDYVDGKFSGKGVLDMKNGDRYAGEFKDGKFNGIGKLTFKKGGYWEGTFTDGKQNKKEVQVATTRAATSNRHEGKVSNIAPSEGIFKNPSLNDWCTMQRMDLWKNPDGDGKGMHKMATAYVGYFVKAKSFSDEFEREAWKNSATDKIYKKLQSCKDFTDKVTLEVGYTYRKDDYDFNEGSLRIQVAKELAKYPYYSKYLVDPNYAGRVYVGTVQDEPTVGDALVTKMNEDGLVLPIGNLYNIGPSVHALYRELNVPITSESASIFRQNFRFSGYNDIKVPMTINEVKSLRNLSNSNKLRAVIDYRISRVEDNVFAKVVYIKPKRIKFVNTNSKEVLFDKECLDLPGRL